MTEVKRIVEEMQSVFAESSYPPAFLEAYDQMECLASHPGRETFLVRSRKDGSMAIAKCWDRKHFPLRPHLELLQDIVHPGLPRFRGQYQNEQMTCVVREYVEGDTLSEYVQRKQPEMHEIISFARQLCDILSVLHTHTPPVIHRDIKPENIIVRPDGRLVLIDFELSRAYKAHAESDTLFFGTRGYAPPEQYGFGQTDQRTDVYAFGVLLRWMVTGSVRENPNITMDPAMHRLIDRCTAFTPEARYPSAAEIRKELDRLNRPRHRISAVQWILGVFLLLTALCCGFALGRWTGFLKATPRIAFSEPLIEQAVRLQLDRPTGPLQEADLLQVRQILIYGTQAYADMDVYKAQVLDEHEEGQLRTLEDLRHLPNLEELFIVLQGDLDARPIAQLASLHKVEFKHMRLTGVQPIASIPRLREAILFDCGLYDVTALENCPWLEVLNVGGNEMTNLTAVGAHPNVRSLNLSWLKLDNLNGLADRFPRLENLSIAHSEIPDLSGLRQTDRLKRVTVSGELADLAASVLDSARTAVLVEDN